MVAFSPTFFTERCATTGSTPEGKKGGLRTFVPILAEQLLDEE
ncbi:hypothetical protein ACNO8S_03965 [Haloarcula sp. KBTZ06]